MAGCGDLWFLAVTANCRTRGSSIIDDAHIWLIFVPVFIHTLEFNSIWPDWLNLVPALVSFSSVPLSTTPPVASVHYLQQRGWSNRPVWQFIHSTGRTLSGLAVGNAAFWRL